MNPVILIMIFFAFIFFVVLFGALIIASTYKYNADIDVPNGENPNQFTRIRDKAKVVRSKGKIIIRFRKIKFVSPSIPYKNWVSFGKTKGYVIAKRDENGAMQWEDGWSDTKTKLARGLWLRMDTEGELRPVQYVDSFTAEPVLSQGNRNFLIDQIKENEEIAKGTWEKVMPFVSVVVVALAIAALTIVWMTWVGNHQLACTAPHVVTNASSIAQGVVGA